MKFPNRKRKIQDIFDKIDDHYSKNGNLLLMTMKMPA